MLATQVGAPPRVSREKPVSVDGTQMEAAIRAARGNKIEKPRIRIDGYVFAPAPAHGNNPGAIYVKTTGHLYLGKIQGGVFFPIPVCTGGQVAAIAAICASPRAAARAYGMRTGRCSLCGRKLTAAESVDLGIGPICRDKFGWGL